MYKRQGQSVARQKAGAQVQIYDMAEPQHFLLEIHGHRGGSSHTEDIDHIGLADAPYNPAELIVIEAGNGFTDGIRVKFR